MAGQTEGNAYAGGINFSAPQFGGSGSVNSGFSFDLPLATVASFQNQALGFLAGNSARNAGFLGQTIAFASSGVDAAQADAFTFLNRGLTVARDASYYNVDAMGTIARESQQQATERTRMATKRSGCYITTAICETDNLPDDCDELKTFRKFRDEFMLTDSVLAPLVAEYYETAPDIVARIKSFPNKGMGVFRYLRRQYLMPALAAIQVGNYAEALREYVNMTRAARTFAEA